MFPGSLQSQWRATRGEGGVLRDKISERRRTSESEKRGRAGGCVAKEGRSVGRRFLQKPAKLRGRGTGHECDVRSGLACCRLKNAAGRDDSAGFAADDGMGKPQAESESKSKGTGEKMESGASSDLRRDTRGRRPGRGSIMGAWYKYKSQPAGCFLPSYPGTGTDCRYAADAKIRPRELRGMLFRYGPCADLDLLVLPLFPLETGPGAKAA